MLITGSDLAYNADNRPDKSLGQPMSEYINYKVLLSGETDEEV